MMTRVRQFLQSLRNDEGGVSAVEFALIAPMVIVMYFAIVEVCQATLAERRTVRTASAVADLLAQSNATITPADITQTLKIGDTLMSPFPAGTALKLCVAGITANASGVKKVDWSQATNSASCPAEGSTVTGTVGGNLAAGQSVVWAKATYVYTGPSSMVIRGGITFNEDFFYRPRKASAIQCPTCT